MLGRRGRGRWAYMICSAGYATSLSCSWCDRPNTDEIGGGGGGAHAAWRMAVVGCDACLVFIRPRSIEACCWLAQAAVAIPPSPASATNVVKPIEVGWPGP
jgi:hypothetical protein